MTSPTLAERAAAKAGRTDAADSTAAEPQPSAYQPTTVPDLGEYEPGDGDPEMVPVHLAWLRVRRDIRGIAKRELYNGGGTRFNFRGVDTVVNTFGPVTLKHGVNILPVEVDAEYRDTTSAKGSKMRECTVRVAWQVIGPKGDTLPMLLASQGEALDSADKGTAKAQSVALRVLLLTAGLTPTDTPDPDSSYIERGEAPVRTARDYLDEILRPITGRQRLAQINYEIKSLGIHGTIVENEHGVEEPLGALLFRVGQERIAGGAQ